MRSRELISSVAGISKLKMTAIHSSNGAVLLGFEHQ